MFGGELNYQVSPVRTEKKWQTKLGASNPTPSTDSVIASLEQMLMKPPMKVDLQEMEELLNAVEALGTPAAKGVVKRGLDGLVEIRRAERDILVVQPRIHPGNRPRNDSARPGREHIVGQPAVGAAPPVAGDGLQPADPEVNIRVSGCGRIPPMQHG